MKTILITNNVVLNGGDAAILFGMMKSLRSAFGDESRILVYASQPDVARRLFPEIEFREALGFAATRVPFSRVRYLGRILRAVQRARYLGVAWCWARGMHFAAYCLPPRQRAYLREYAEADVIASSGGTYLKEEYGVDAQACDYRLTLLLGTPLVFFTQSLGPFTQPRTRKLMREVFNRASCILLRDEQSRRNVQALGVTRVPVHLAADAAFALADPATLERAKTKSRRAGGLRVAVSVRYWRHFSGCAPEEGSARYRSSVAEAVRQLSAEGARITFLSTCQGIPEYDDDSKEADRIVELLDPQTAGRVRIAREPMRYEQILESLKDFDLCIGTRMHMCILSLIAGTPALPIAYEFKTRALFAALGMEDWVSDMESISPAAFCERVRSFQKAIPALSGALFERVLDLHYSALRAGSVIREELEGSSDSAALRTFHARSHQGFGVEP